MNELIPIIFLQLSATLCAEVKPKDVWSGCVRLDKLSANESLTSGDDLVSYDFCVHHDGVIEVDA
jgi:hypothetical protein